MPSSRIRITAIIFSVGIFCVLFEIISFALFRTAVISQGVFRGVADISPAEFEAYLRDRDPLLGWPSQQRLESGYTGSGYRKSPAIESLDAKEPPCLAVYGDSFAFAEEVSDADAWANRLTRILGCKVLNFGVGGFGTDQAVMRFEKLHPPGVPALLTYIITDIGRGRNQVRGIWNGLIDMRQGKPSFRIIEAPYTGRAFLERVDLPINDYADRTILEDSRQIGQLLDNEYFLPDRSKWSAVTIGFPYSWSLLRWSQTRMLQKLARTEVGLGLYLYSQNATGSGFLHRAKIFAGRYIGSTPEQDAEALRLHQMIIQRFTSRCQAKGINCAVLLIPNLSRSLYAHRSGQDRGDLIGAHNDIIAVHDRCLVSGFIRQGVEEDQIPIQLAPGGHYNPVANRVFAECVAGSAPLMDRLKLAVPLPE